MFFFKQWQFSQIKQAKEGPAGAPRPLNKRRDGSRRLGLTFTLSLQHLVTELATIGPPQPNKLAVCSQFDLSRQASSVARATFHHPFMHLLCALSFCRTINSLLIQMEKVEKDQMFGREQQRVAEMAIRHITVDVFSLGTGSVGTER